MFNDNIIYFFQLQIGSQCKVEHVLEDPQRGRVRKFLECTSEFVQILHDGERHWVCIFVYGCQPGKVEVMDTFYGGAVSNEVKKQIYIKQFNI